MSQAIQNSAEISENLETKKRKLLEEYENFISKKANIEPKEISKAYPVLFPIVADEYHKSVETEKYFVGKIISKKETSRLIKEFSSVYPLEGRSYLKRVKWTDEKDVFEILIRPIFSNETVSSILLSDVLGSSKVNTTGLMDTVKILDIPKDPVRTYKQFKEASTFWPVQYREDKYIERLLKHEFFTGGQKTDIQMYLQLCNEAAKYGDEKVGCVVVDPVTSKIIAISHDRRHHHPIQHAVMVATELVAKGQGGGSWDIESEYTYHIPYVQEEIDEKIAKFSEMYPGKEAKKLCLPYLCTGYDLYVSREPCVMCAMALVHSRIQRVFYVTETPWGALGSHWKLHLQEGLNHHYEVFKVVLNKQCSLENATSLNKTVIL